LKVNLGEILSSVTWLRVIALLLLVTTFLGRGRRRREHGGSAFPLFAVCLVGAVILLSQAKWSR
jgi:Na+/glutamate symporter